MTGRFRFRRARGRPYTGSVRCWWLVVLLACQACYQPSETCVGVGCVPDDAATPDDAVPSDGTTDGPSDAPLVTCVDSSFNTPTLAGVTGKSYSQNSSSLALVIDTNDDLLQITSPGNTPLPVMFTPTTGLTGLTRPVLAASTSNNDVHAFFIKNGVLSRSTRVNGTTWMDPIVISTPGVTIDDSTFVFGQPTDTIPRRAFASGSGKAYEAVETSDTSWSFTEVTVAGATSVQHPSLSRDGKALVYVGFENSTLQLYLAKRANVDVGFTSPTALLDQPAGVGGDEQFPRFGPDCDHIFLSIETTVVDLH